MLERLGVYVYASCRAGTISFSLNLVKKKKIINKSHYRPEMPRGFQEIKFPRLRDNGPRWW